MGLLLWNEHFHFADNRSFTCNGVNLVYGIDTLTKVKDLNTCSTADQK